VPGQPLGNLCGFLLVRRLAAVMVVMMVVKNVAGAYLHKQWHQSRQEGSSF
jgi:hypothetical protein